MAHWVAGGGAAQTRSGCRAQGSQNLCWTIVVWGWFLTHLAVVSWVSQSLGWPTDERGWILVWLAEGSKVSQS